MMRKEGIFIIISILLFMGLYLFFYPTFYTTMDEAGYFDFAYNLKEGRILYEDPMYAHFTLDAGKGLVSYYTIGLSALLLPFTFISWKALFLLNPLLHIGAFWFVYKILKKCSINPYMSFFYLFYPGFVLYARTLTADMVSASLFVIAFYFYLKDDKKNYFISGVIFGLICLIKYYNIILAGCAVLARLFFPAKGKRLNILYLCYGILPFALFILLYNYRYYGGIFQFPYRIIGIEFSFNDIVRNLPVYIASTLLIYPLMIISPFMVKNHNAIKRPGVIICFIFLLFISSNFFHQGSDYVHSLSFRHIAKYLMVSQRYILPIITLLLMFYLIILDRYAKKGKNRNIFIVFALCVFLMGVYVSFAHQKYLLQGSAIRDAIYQNTEEGGIIICDGETSKFLQKNWGDRKYVDVNNENLSHYITDKTYLVVFYRQDKPQNVEKSEDRISYILSSHSHNLIHQMKGELGVDIYKIK